MLVGQYEKHGAFGRFFKEFQQRVLRLHVHLLSVPNYVNLFGAFLSQGDVLWFIYELMQHGETDILSQCERTLVKQIVPAGKYTAAHIDIPETELVERALEQNYVPLVDDRKSFIGIVTRRSIMSKKFKPL